MTWPFPFPSSCNIHDDALTSIPYSPKLSLPVTFYLFYCSNFLLWPCSVTTLNHASSGILNLQPRNPVLRSDGLSFVPPFLLVHLTHSQLSCAQSLTTPDFLSYPVWSLWPITAVLGDQLPIILVPASFQLWINPTFPFYAPGPMLSVLSVSGENYNHVYGHCKALLLSCYLSCQLSSFFLFRQLCLNRVDVNFAHWNPLGVF